ncbi:hypothetical protein QCA50_000745 [Cerrena zonata]|uniref:Uncharacterized protein n=1 Tax=Cerrena zonata TaxID=2478898 RepID=A0AAW0GZJ3_9APHY
MQNSSRVDYRSMHNTYRSPEDQWYNVPSSSSTYPNRTEPPRDIRLSRFSTVDAIRPLPRVPTPCIKAPRPLPAVPCISRPIPRRPLPVPSVQPELRVLPVDTGSSRCRDQLTASPEPIESISPLCLDDDYETSSETSEETEAPEESEDDSTEPYAQPCDVVREATPAPMEIVLYGPSNGYGAVHFQTHSYRREYLKIEGSAVGFDADVDDSESLETSECTAPPSYHGFPYQPNHGRYFSEKPPVWHEETKPKTNSMMKGLLTRKWVMEKKGKRYELEDDYQKIIGALRRL